MTASSLKVGILTFHDVFNPGAFLQAYATQELLTRMGHNAEIINYNPPAHRYHPLRYALKQGWRLPLRLKKWSDAFVRDLAFSGARKSHLKLSMLHEVRGEIARIHYDAVLVGADIVWNFKNPNLGNDPVYFGEGLSTDRLIAFAPSSGACTLDDVIPEYVSKGLHRFDSLSARDPNTAEIVKKASGRSAEVICDPTFHIIDQIDDFPNRDLRRGFILIYLLPGQDTSQRLIKQVQALSAKTNLPVYAVLYRHKWADQNIIKCDPFLWLDLIRNASYVVTNTFHGTIFSILTKANFVLEYNDLVRSKTERMVSSAGLDSRVFTQDSDLSAIFEAEIDYDRAFIYFRSEASKALSYLSNALV
jgi:hypothetical protein